MFVTSNLSQTVAAAAPTAVVTIGGDATAGINTGAGTGSAVGCSTGVSSAGEGNTASAGCTTAGIGGAAG